jgi:hypothetical protein
MILASYIRPFDAKQKIYVLDKKKDTEEIRLADLDTYSETIMQLIAEYNVNEIELHGNETVCEKIKKDILQAEFAKYNNNQLKVEIKGATI